MKRTSLDKTIIDLERRSGVVNKYIDYVRVDEIVNAVEWLKEYQSKIDPVPSHEDEDGVPHCGSCGWIQSWGCNYCDNCGKRLKWE